MILSRVLLKWMRLSPEEREARAIIRAATQCARGDHAKLEWHKVSRKRSILINNQPMEMMAASGFIGAFCKWIGVCPRCGRQIEWSQSKPREKDLNPKTGSIRP